jgi:large subunit ribosomal protein L37Ae
MKTKKVGAAGRFGSRYGKRIGVNFVNIERLKHSKFVCPNCMKNRVKRESAGIWYCPSCKYKFAGKAYKPG